MDIPTNIHLRIRSDIFDMLYSDGHYRMSDFWRRWETQYADQPAYNPVMMIGTSVFDKKGKEIYELDLCRANKPNSSLGSQNDIYMVEYSPLFAQFVFKCVNSDNSFRIGKIACNGNDQPFLITNKDVEIIGNIYDNSELLP